MNRRDALAVLGSTLIWPANVRAQQSARVPVVGMLITHPPVTDKVVESLRNGLRQYGYEDGRNVKLEVRTALGQLDRVPGLAQELVRLPADVIVLVNEPALRAVRQATTTIPIVMVGYTDDPVTLGWIESYRRPGGNVTGIFNVNSALTGKRLEMLRETLPKVSRVAVLWDPAFGRRPLEELQRAAELLRVQLQPIEVPGPEGLEAAFKTAKRNNAGAVMLLGLPCSISIEPASRDLPSKRRCRPLPTSTSCRGRMPALIRIRQLLSLRARRVFRRSPAEGRQSGGPAGRADLEAEAGGEPQDRQGPRGEDPRVDSGAGRRSHTMSAHAHNRACAAPAVEHTLVPATAARRPRS